jgi:hypothetical protein
MCSDGEIVMTEHYCQMRIIGDGIRLDQQPPQPDCCNQPANEFITVWGRKQWLCPRHYAEHMETRTCLRMDGETLDPQEIPR